MFGAHGEDGYRWDAPIHHIRGLIVPLDSASRRLGIDQGRRVCVVRTLNGDIVGKFSVHATWTNIASLKRMVGAHDTPPRAPCYVKLVYEERVLENDEDLLSSLEDGNLIMDLLYIRQAREIRKGECGKCDLGSVCASCLRVSGGASKGKGGRCACRASRCESPPSCGNMFELQTKGYSKGRLGQVIWDIFLTDEEVAALEEKNGPMK